MKKFQIIYCNEWDVWVTIFSGTEDQCVLEYEKHISRYESLDAIISQK